jgi:hypothetical protein
MATRRGLVSFSPACLLIFQDLTHARPRLFAAWASNPTNQLDNDTL